MFGWEFPPHNSGGLGTACFGLTRALAQAGAEVVFVLPKRFPVSADFLRFRFAEIENVKFRRVPGLLYPYVTSEKYAEIRPGVNSNLYGRSLLEEVQLYAERAVVIAAEEDFDIIHAHDWLAYPAGLAAKRVSGKPLVVHVHATEFDRTGGTGVNQEVYAIEQAGMQQADQIVTVSGWTKNIVEKNYDVPSEKIKVVHNGVDFDSLNFGPKKIPLAALKQAGNKIVLFVGRITLQKGPDYFIQLAQRVLELEPKTYFVVAGSGDMEVQIIREAARLGIAERVIFAGFLRGAELEAMYRAADIYILPSVSEPFGITPLESLVAGTPVLISKQSGVAEVVKHALKVDFWDVEEMTNQVVTVLRHPPFQQTLATYGQQEVRKVTWLEAAKKCLEVYQSVLRFS